MKGKLFLFPNSISTEGKGSDIIIQEIIPQISLWIIENQKALFRFQRFYNVKIDSEIWKIRENDPNFVYEAMKRIESGSHAGLLAESGLVGVADPGSQLIAAAHVRNIPIIPLPGASAITLALAASGLPGQRFAFWGYIPLKPKQLHPFIKKLEKQSYHDQMTQIIMETPYRTPQTLKLLLQILSPDTLFVAAQNVGSLSPTILRKFVAEWTKKDISHFSQQPTLFLFNACFK